MGSFVFVRYFCSTSSGCRKQKNNGKWDSRNKDILEHNEVNFGLTKTRLLDAFLPFFFYFREKLDNFDGIF